MTTDITFRPARAEDCEAAIPLIYSAGPDLFDLIFKHSGFTAFDLLRFEFVKGSGFFGYANHTVAEYQGKLAGIGAFYDGVQYGRLNRATTWHYMQLYKLKLFAGLPYLKAVSVLMKRPADDALYVANLGVAQDMRSLGIGSALLTHQREYAKAKGYREYCLDVATNNPRGAALYQRLGFTHQFERCFHGDTRDIALPGTVRMAMAP